MDAVADDVRNAQDYVRRHADEMDVDPDRLALFGVSFGVPFAATAALAQPGVVCLVCYYGYLDLRHFVGEAPPERCSRRTRHRWRWSSARYTTVARGARRTRPPALNASIDRSPPPPWLPTPPSHW